MVRTHACFYGVFREWTQEEIEYCAQFDVLATGMGHWDNVNLPKVRALNPDITLLRYIDLVGINVPYEPHPWKHPRWDEINANEDWFIHASHGNEFIDRVVYVKWHWYFMNINNSAYRDFITDYWSSLLTDYPIYDGIFADDCFQSDHHTWNVWTSERVYPELLDPTAGEIPEQPEFTANMVKLLSILKSKIGGKLLIPNMATTGPVANEYVKKTDGKFHEGWVHPVWFGQDEWRPRETVLEDGQDLSELSGTGKHYLAESGVDIGDDPFKIRQVALYSLASFLCSQNGPKASFGWTEPAGDGQYKLNGWFAEMGTDTGEPIGKAYVLNPDVFGRSYEKVEVFVNLSETKVYEVTVERKTYVLNARSGLIVEKDLITTPPGFEWVLIPIGLAVALNEIGERKK